MFGIVNKCIGSFALNKRIECKIFQQKGIYNVLQQKIEIGGQGTIIQADFYVSGPSFS